MYGFGETEVTCQISIIKTNLYFCNLTDKAVINMATFHKVLSLILVTVILYN